MNRIFNDKLANQRAIDLVKRMNKQRKIKEIKSINKLEEFNKIFQNGIKKLQNEKESIKQKIVYSRVKRLYELDQKNNKKKLNLAEINAKNKGYKDLFKGHYHKQFRIITNTKTKTIDYKNSEERNNDYIDLHHNLSEDLITKKIIISPNPKYLKNIGSTKKKLKFF